MTENITEDEGVDGRTAADGDASAGRQRARRSAGRARLLQVLALLVAVGLLLGYLLWWTRPTTFNGVGNRFGFEQTTETLHPVTVDMVQRSVHADAETITLDDVVPRVVTNTADAVITVVVCRRDRIAMATDGPATRMCDTVTDVEGRRLRLTPAFTTTVAMTVTPRRPGRVVVKGVEVDYSRGPGHLWQRGSQATGPVVEVRVEG